MTLPRLHVVTDDAVLESPSFAVRATGVLEAGGPGVALHVRGPRTSGRRTYEATLALVEPARRAGAWLMVNDRADVVLAAGADGVHLGARSLAPHDARRLLGPERAVGLSAHGDADVLRAVAATGPDGRGLEGGTSVDYVFIGHVFATPSHAERTPGGRAMVEAAVAAAGGTPVLAIGGITVERLADVLAWGGYGVAVLRGVWNAPDPALAVERYRSLLAAGSTVRHVHVKQTEG